LIIGIDDKTYVSCDRNRPSNEDITTKYHPDRLNEIIGRYSLPKFEVRVNYKEYQGHLHPEIKVPGDIDPSVA